MCCVKTFFDPPCSWHVLVFHSDEKWRRASPFFRRCKTGRTSIWWSSDRRTNCEPFCRGCGTQSGDHSYIEDQSWITSRLIPMFRLDDSRSIMEDSQPMIGMSPPSLAPVLWIIAWSDKWQQSVFAHQTSLWRAAVLHIQVMRITSDVAEWD